MDSKITNKIVGLNDILNIAQLMREHCLYYEDLELKEQYKKQEAQARQDFYSPKYIHGEVKYIIQLNNNQTIEKTNEFEWFQDALISHAPNISTVSLRFSATEEDKRESLYIDFHPSKIYYDTSNANMYQSILSQRVESYINNLPPRYDKIIAYDTRRTAIPAMSIGIPLALILMFACLFIGKSEVVASNIANILTNKITLVAIFGVVVFFGTLLIPTKNTMLYKNIKINTYYAGYDEKHYRGIHKNDYEDFKSKCEVAIGENAQMPQVREQIEQNYKKAKKVVFVEFLIAIASIAILFIL